MSYSGETADQVVRMTLNGVEVAAKLSGKAARLQEVKKVTSNEAAAPAAEAAQEAK